MAFYEFTLTQWLMKSLFGIFFIVGFNAIYVSLSFESLKMTYGKKRGALLATLFTLVYTIGTSALFFFARGDLSSNPILTVNVAIFTLAVSLVSVEMKLWNYLIRSVALIALWLYPYQFLMTARYISLFAGLIVVLTINWIFHIKFGHKFWPRIIFLAYLGLAYWSSRVDINGGPLKYEVISQGFLMFMVFGLVSGVYLIYQGRRVEHDRELTKLADYDALTSAKTYSMYTRDAKKMFERARALELPMTLVTLDVDHFKSINDTYGHLAGNEVLVGVVTTLRNTLGKYDKSDQVYRTGGEEFNIPFPGKNPAEVRPIIQACFESIRSAEFHYNEYMIRVTISVGVTAVHGEDEIIDDTYKRADDNLYTSKHNGRDQITIEGKKLAHTN